MKIRILISACCFAALVNCGFNPGNIAPETGNNHSSITGKLLQADGKSPASGVVVTLRSSDAVAPIVGSALAKIKANKRVVLTDANGGFAIDSCNAGEYVIEGVADKGKAVRIDSVIVRDTGKTTEVPPQSLQATGALRGTVVLDGGGDPGNVFILAFGSDRFVQAQSDGKFFMGDLPYGNYDLKIVSVLTEYEGCKTMPISVAPGDTVCADTIYFKAQDLCVPQNVALHYDSMLQRVSLRWDSCKSPNVKGYNVYRYDTANTYMYTDEPLNNQGIIGTCSYTDDSLLFNHTYVYGVAAVSKDGAIGSKSVPALSVTTALVYRVDTLYDPDGLGGSGYGISSVFWNSDNRLVIASCGKSQVSIFDYGDDFSIVRRSDIALPFGRGANVVVDGENVYLLNYLTWAVGADSCIYSYKRDGTLRSVCNVHTWFQDYDVRNDTFFVYPFSSGMVSAFDTTGRVLLNLCQNDPCDNVGILWGTPSAEGGFFIVHSFSDPDPNYPGYGPSATDRWELHKLNFATMNEKLYASGGGTASCFNIRGNLYLYHLLDMTMNGLVAADFNGNLVARFPELNVYNGTAINSRGQIACIQNHQRPFPYHDYVRFVTVLTPPSLSVGTQ
jgi:hypothetical protein